jgi:hypothetical protein
VIVYRGVYDTEELVARDDWLEQVNTLLILLGEALLQVIVKLVAVLQNVSASRVGPLDGEVERVAKNGY